MVVIVGHGLGRRLGHVALNDLVVVGLVLIDGLLVEIHHLRMDQIRRFTQILADETTFAFGRRVGRRSVRIAVLGAVLDDGLIDGQRRHFSGRWLVDGQRQPSRMVNANVIDSLGRHGAAVLVLSIGLAVISGPGAGQCGRVQIRHAPLAESGTGDGLDVVDQRLRIDVDVLFDGHGRQVMMLNGQFGGK